MARSIRTTASATRLGRDAWRMQSTQRWEGDLAMNASIRTPPQSPLGAMYEEHIGFITSKNVGGLLSQYTDDCLLISMRTADRQPLYVRGHEQLRELFVGRIFGLEDLEVVHNQWAETDNTLLPVKEAPFPPVPWNPSPVQCH